MRRMRSRPAAPEKSASFELRLLTKTGDVRWAHCICAPRAAHDGELAGMLFLKSAQLLAKRVDFAFKLLIARVIGLRRRRPCGGKEEDGSRRKSLCVQTNDHVRGGKRMRRRGLRARQRIR